MNDEQLLRLAAKAAGWPVTGRAPAYMCAHGSDLAFIVQNDRGGESVWNPLTDDGDALRLAVKLRLVIDADQGEVLCPHEPARGVHYAGPRNAESIRRAIVRAAAAIGEKL